MLEAKMKCQNSNNKQISNVQQWCAESKQNTRFDIWPKCWAKKWWHCKTDLLKKRIRQIMNSAYMIEQKELRERTPLFLGILIIPSFVCSSKIFRFMSGPESWLIIIFLVGRFQSCYVSGFLYNKFDRIIWG